MNIGIQFTDKSGDIVIADVVRKKVLTISSTGAEKDWQPYETLKGGYVGEKLTVILPPHGEWAARPIMTDEIIKLEFPKLED